LMLKSMLLSNSHAWRIRNLMKKSMGEQPVTDLNTHIKCEYDSPAIALKVEMPKGWFTCCNMCSMTGSILRAARHCFWLE
jgi:hypothetical protein